MNAEERRRPRLDRGEIAANPARLPPPPRFLTPNQRRSASRPRSRSRSRSLAPAQPHGPGVRFSTEEAVATRTEEAAATRTEDAGGLRISLEECAEERSAASAVVLATTASGSGSTSRARSGSVGSASRLSQDVRTPSMTPARSARSGRFVNSTPPRTPKRGGQQAKVGFFSVDYSSTSLTSFREILRTADASGHTPLPVSSKVALPAAQARARNSYLRRGLSLRKPPPSCGTLRPRPPISTSPTSPA